MLAHQLLKVADAYCSATGRSRARVSTVVFNQGGKLDALAAGKDLNGRTFCQAMTWFADNWPEGAPWPAWPEGRPDWLERDYSPARTAGAAQYAAEAAGRVRNHPSCPACGTDCGRAAAPSPENIAEEFSS